MESKTYVFKSSEGNLAWAVVTAESVTCYVPQMGDWYEQKFNLPDGTDWAAVAKACLQQCHVWISGEGTESSMLPGQYHPRIWRGLYSPNSIFEGYDRLSPRGVYGSTYNSCIVASESLFAEVKELFRIVEPCERNAGTYGHRIRELLILLCTEIEACWSGVLKANGKGIGRLSTQDYVWTCEPLRLKEWKVKLKDYDVFLEPFVEWSPERPTQSIPWYDAYNKVKHDREGSFEYASMFSVLQSAAALHILQVAQFGPSVFDMLHGNRFSIFELVGLPEFSLDEIYYAYPLTKDGFVSPLMFGAPNK